MAALTLRSIRLCTLALGAALALAPPALADDVSVKLDAGTGFSIKNSTGTVERLRVDEATGNISRNGALFVHTTGAGAPNLFVGPSAGNTGTTGPGGNVGIGFGALGLNTTGLRNTAVGYHVLSNNSTGSYNSAFGSLALHGNTTGFYNSGIGYHALGNNTTGSQNSAVGFGALFINTTGTFNSAVGSTALFNNTGGSSNSALGASALRNNTTGFRNSAVGFEALLSNTTGYHNAAVGVYALRNNTTGTINSGFGVNALRSNTTGGENSGFGYEALRANQSGGKNSAFGLRALQYTTGTGNTAVGRWALHLNTSGSYNVAVGMNAGENQNTGSNNIYLANFGVAAESGTIRIGTSTPATHTRVFIAGVSGTSVAGSAVLVNASGQLGVAASSGRFKEAVEDMGDASESLMTLRPVRFRYRKDAGGDGHTQEYGLIAEEVAAVAPELVVYDEKGQPFTVKYHEMTPMLLNEMKKQQRTIAKLEAQQQTIEAQQQEIAVLTTRLARLEAHAR